MSLFQEIFWYFDLTFEDFQNHQGLAKQYDIVAKFAFAHLPAQVLRVISKRKKFKYAFLGAKYEKLIKALGPEHVIVLGVINHWPKSFELGAAFEPNGWIYKKLMDCYRHPDESGLERIIDECSRKLAGWNVEALVVVNDSLPVERIWISAARRAGVRSICIQHGLASKKYGEISDGKYADVIGVYDQGQLEILTYANALNPQIMGYPDEVRSLPLTGAACVCILGGPWCERYVDKGLVYLERLSHVIRFLEARNISCVYKPHPVEKEYVQFDFLRHKKNRIYRGDLQLAIRKMDVFLSFTSTALMEASLAHKIAIQLYEPLLAEERYDEMGYSYAVDARSLEGLESLILARKPFPIALDSRPLKERFLALLS